MPEKHTAPKTIWLYWDQGEENAPELVRRCIKSWRHFNPDWTVHVLDAESAKRFVSLELPDSTLTNIGLTKKSDILRLALLAKHGGVWADASTLCTAPLTNWMPDISQSGFFAFRDPGRDRLLSSWFLIASPGNVIVTELLNYHYDFFSRTEYRIDSRWRKKVVSALSKLTNKNAEMSRIWARPILSRTLKCYPYFIFHYMFADIIHTNGLARAAWDRTTAINARLPHLAARLSFGNSGTPESIEKITGLDTSIHKLTYKRNSDKELDRPDSLLRWLLYEHFPAE